MWPTSLNLFLSTLHQDRDGDLTGPRAAKLWRSLMRLQSLSVMMRSTYAETTFRPGT